MKRSTHPQYPLQRNDRRCSHNRTVGNYGEALAAAHLEGQGFKILDRNWRNGRHGELDIIAREGSVHVAVEVKTRTGSRAGHPLEAITAIKVRRLWALLCAWQNAQNVPQRELRVDAVSVLLLPNGSTDIQHLRGIA